MLPPTTFEAGPGELWCVTGPNGSGKTTLLRALGGRIALASGAVFVHGRPINVDRAWQRKAIASLVEPIPVARDLTVDEQVAMVAVSWFGQGARARADVETMLDIFRLHGLADRFPHELSAGQRQQLMLALVLVRPADILLLDEPERHLDVERSTRLVELLAVRAGAGVTIIAATHSVSLVEAADRQLTLR